MVQTEDKSNVVELSDYKNKNMADLEKGFTMIADQIVDALCQIRLSGSDFRVAMAVIRKTYGFKKKSDFIANSQLAEATGLTKKQVSKSVSNLIERKILLAFSTGYIKELGINKDTDSWENPQKRDKNPQKEGNSKIPKKEDFQTKKEDFQTKKEEIGTKIDPHNIDIELETECVCIGDHPFPQQFDPPDFTPTDRRFFAIWNKTPIREGDNPQAKAYFAYQDCLKNGFTVVQMIQGLERYTEYIKATNRTGTKYVKQLATFLAEKGFLEKWEITDAKPKTKSKSGTNSAVERRRARYRGNASAERQSDPGDTIEGSYSVVVGRDGGDLHGLDP